MPFLSKHALLHQLDQLGIRLDKNRGMCYLVDRNIVNVIFVDFRALDTMGEITVLSVAALGVYALLQTKKKKSE